MRHHSHLSPVVLSIAIAGVAASRACAVDYEIRTSRPLVSLVDDSGTFDGTTHGTLPTLLDSPRLQGGSFRATFRFTAVTPVAGTNTLYDLTPTSGITYDLLDPVGLVVHHGSNSSEPIAILSNNYGGAPFTVDQILLSASVNAITGFTWPAAIYTPPGDLFSFADINCFGNVSPGVEYLSDLSIPTDPATYLAFPTKNFDVFLEFDDGDAAERVGPHQYANAQLSYDLASFTVTAVPEPTIACLLLSAMALRRRRP